MIVDENGISANGSLSSYHATRPRLFDPIVHMTFNDQDSQLLYYHAPSPVYRRFQKIGMVDSIDPNTSNVMENTSQVRFRGETPILPLQFSIAIPFFSTHESYRRNTTIAQQHRMVCEWRYLSLGIAKHPSEGWTVACLLKNRATCRHEHCQHRENLDRGRRFDLWDIVAHLWGYESSEHSLGGNLVATSPRSTRLAIANWKTIYIWAMEPRELIDGNPRGYYPEEIENYKNPRSLDPRNKKGLLELKPIVLSLNSAVCFGLTFTEDEDSIIALTDHGVMRWNLSARAKGAREHVSLGMKESSDRLYEDDAEEDEQEPVWPENKHEDRDGDGNEDEDEDDEQEEESEEDLEDEEE